MPTPSKSSGKKTPGGGARFSEESKAVRVDDDDDANDEDDEASDFEDDVNNASAAPKQVDLLAKKAEMYGSTSPVPLDQQFKKAANRRMSKALSSHIVLTDDFRNFKLGDVVRARPPGDTVYYEGVAVSVDDETVTIDFGDDAPPVVCDLDHVQRVNNGIVMEVDDIVQCKCMGVYCMGRILRVNQDGTFNVGYEGCDDVDENVDPSFLRKIGSGRSSTKQRFKKAVAAITAIRAFKGSKMFETDEWRGGNSNSNGSSNNNTTEGKYSESKEGGTEYKDAA